MDTKDQTLDHTRREIAQKVGQLRRERRLTQTNLAQLLGLSQGRFSQIENGQGSFSAEQLVLLIKNFNLPLRYFIKSRKDTGSSLQNALSQLGASQLSENQDAIPSEKLLEALDVIREVLISSELPRHIVAIAPVLIQHARNLAFHKLKFQLAQLGLENRLGWLIESTLAGIEHELSTPLSRKWQERYKRTTIILKRHLSNWARVIKRVPRGEEDILDRDILTDKSIEEVRSASSPIAKKWGIITRIQIEDFVNALRSSRGID